jgi:hypothetical protein
MEECMEQANILGQMEWCMKGNSSITASQAKVNTLGQMGVRTKVM